MLLGPPPGSAINERGQSAPTSYEEEYLRLPLEPFEPPLKVNSMSSREFIENAKLIMRMGENKEIRDYACKFFVRVWDMTGEGEKELYQKIKEEVVESAFMVYRVREDEWPHPVGEKPR